jgi:Mce-associated membrane protein
MSPTRLGAIVIQEQNLKVRSRDDQHLNQEAGKTPIVEAATMQVTEEPRSLVRHDEELLEEAGTSENTPASDTDEEIESSPTTGTDPGVKRRIRVKLSWTRVLVFVILPVTAMGIGLAAAWLKWQVSTERLTELAGSEAVQAATDNTVAILSYTPDSVDKDLVAAEGRLTGTFKDAYIKLTRDVVIPGAKQQKISAEATVPAAALVSSSPTNAVVLLAVDQTIVIGNEAPSKTASGVRVTLEKSDGRWLISGFDPV